MHGDCKYEYDAEIIRAIDGDTVVARIDLGFHTYSVQTLRLYGINTPEVRGEDKQAGISAANHLRSLIKDHAPLTITTIKDRQGKYGRFLATLYGAGGCNINKQLVDDGHAVEKDY